MRTPSPLTTYVPVLMSVQSLLGLVWPAGYRDTGIVRETWLGNDLITLGVVAPLLILARRRAARGSTRAHLLWMGGLGYGVYNYAFYLFGAALNPFFVLYVVAWVASVAALAIAIVTIDARDVASRIRANAPIRVIAGYLIFVAGGLACVWVAMWAAYVFAGRPTPIEPQAFKLVAALDLSLMVPALAGGGILLWRGRPWGYVVAAIAGVQATLYLVVLSANSVVFIARGLTPAPGELPVWGVLALTMGLAVGGILARVRGYGGCEGAFEGATCDGARGGSMVP